MDTRHRTDRRRPDARLSQIVNDYCTANPAADRDRIEDALYNLKDITKKQVGIIELDGMLDIETVTEIFIRINSKGVVLSQADFAMSKIAANETYGGSLLRKCIDYFCHLAVAPEFYRQISEEDTEFAATEYLPKIAWLKNENDDLYDPDYGDLLRVAFTAQFSRGRLSELVSLLSGRNFETRSFEEEIAAASFARLTTGVLEFVNETNFKRFLMIVKSAGFIDSWMLRSKNAVNFAYILYLKLRSESFNADDIERYVRRWLALSLLTSRYSGSAESQFDFDIKSLSGGRFPEYLAGIEAADLSDAFWNVRLVQQLNTASLSNPSFSVYLAALCRNQSRGFLSREISVRELIEHRGDIHHIFPKDYLKKLGINRTSYNQVANMVYMQSEINVKVGNRSPREYFAQMVEQCNGGGKSYGGIDTLKDLHANLAENDMPHARRDGGHGRGIQHVPGAAPRPDGRTAAEVLREPVRREMRPPSSIEGAGSALLSSAGCSSVRKSAAISIRCRGVVLRDRTAGSPPPQRLECNSGRTSRGSSGRTLSFVVAELYSATGASALFVVAELYSATCYSASKSNSSGPRSPVI
ncbi:MAG TPA: hypothetical protein VHI13_10765 [Candidatus Kapabacteria bacterium]|nr:hypothetical protein [Candidatus Kapabacteria bacterium]